MTLFNIDENRINGIQITRSENDWNSKSLKRFFIYG
jgi:hypothetical protein